MKTKLIILSLLALTTGLSRVNAYSDHRGHKTDSLEAVLAAQRPLSDEERINAYKELMWGYLNTNGRRAADYARKAVALSYGHDWQNTRADALRILGLVAYGTGDYETALGYFNHALALTDSMRNNSNYQESTIDDNYAVLYGSIANLYNMQDKAHLAIAYYQKAQPIFEKYKWLESSAILFHNMAELYMSMGNYDEALLNFKKAVEYGEQSEDSLLVAMACKGLAKVYIGSDYDQAEQAAMKAYEYYRNHTDEEHNDYLTTLCDLGRVQLKGRNNLTRAKAYAQEGLSLIGEETGAEQRADVYCLCSEIALAGRQWAEARDYALQALASDTVETYDDLSAYVLLAQACIELGERQQAREYVAHIYNGMERFATSHYQSGLSQMQVLYETEKKQAEIEQLVREKQLHLWGGLLVATLLLLVALLFFAMWRSVKLSKKNAMVQAKLEGELAERVRLSRDLHDRLGGTLTALRQHLTDPQALALTDEAIGEMRNVAHHLLPDSLRRYGLRTALRDYCHSMKNVSFAYMGQEEHVPQEEVIYCIVYELVNNAVKNASAQHISVQLMAEPDFTAINVSDDGSGMADDPEGFGLQNIRERVAAANGKLDIFSQPGQGTEINIELPRNK